jgi:hypothetical protein
MNVRLVFTICTCVVATAAGCPRGVDCTDVIGPVDGLLDGGAYAEIRDSDHTPEEKCAMACLALIQQLEGEEDEELGDVHSRCVAIGGDNGEEPWDPENTEVMISCAYDEENCVQHPI